MTTSRPVPTPSVGVGRDLGGSRPWGTVIAGVWLVFLLDPLHQAWLQRDTTSGVVAIGALGAFALLYLWHFYGSRLGAVGPTRRHHSTLNRWLSYLGLVGLSAVTTVALGPPGTGTWVFVAVSGLWTLGLRGAIAVAVVLAITYEVLVHTLSGWSRDSGVSLSILLAMLAVSAAVLANRRARDLALAREENARLAIEEERHRLARDVHDILGHSLTVITVKAELAGRLFEIDPARARTEVGELEALAREALADVRGAVEGMHEISLPGELARARQALTTAGVRAELPTAVDSVQPSLKQLFAWAVREGVTNVIRHAHASTCTITLGPNEIRIRDDGKGVSCGTAGNGLRGLQDRAAAVGALVTTRVLEPHGFEVSVFTRKNA